jgi:AcrR family transcriptional regulator
MIHKYSGGAEMNTLSANINDKRCLRTRLAIKSALLSLLEDKPLAKITVSELAETAQVNRKTFYNHYLDINSVLYDIETVFLDDIFAIIDKNNIWGEIENPSGFILRFFEIIRDNMQMFHLLVRSGEHIHLMESFRQRLRNHWSDQLFGRENADEILLTYLMDYVAGGTVSLLENWAKNPNNMSLEDLAQFTSIVVSASAKPIINAMFEK